MSIFTRNPLTPEQVEKIVSETGCSKSEAISRAKTAKKKGMDIDYFMDEGFYQMDKSELTKYLKRANPRRYIEAMKKRSYATDYEIYRQMRRAKSEYGITYSEFAKKNLVNATDERLEKVSALNDARHEKSIQRVADSLNISPEEAKKILNTLMTKQKFALRDIMDNRLYLMNDQELSEFRDNRQSNKDKNVQKVAELTGWTPEQVRVHMVHCESEFGINSTVYFCSKCYKLDDYQLALCGNCTDSKKISKIYNTTYSKYLSNKLLFNEKYKDYVGRKFWVNRDSSFDEFEEFADGLDELFCKPLDSSSGLGTFKYDLRGKDKKEAYEYLMEQPKCLVEECVVQHPEMAKFYPNSLNTVRLTTILDDGEYIPLLSLVRFGVNGVVDNYSAGGVACAVDPRTGIILNDASNEEGERFEKHPISGITFKGFQIPHWDKVLECTEAALRSVDEINYVGWDIAITDDGVVLIEGNSLPSMGNQQSISDSDEILIRPIYYKYIGTSVYDDMLDKVIDAMRLTGARESVVTKRLMVAAESGFDYDFVKDQEIYRLTPKQIRRYADEGNDRVLVDRVAAENDSSAAEAFLQMRHAEVQFDIPFDRFCEENMFGFDDDELKAAA